jgi:acetyl esterase/lipase
MRRNDFLRYIVPWLSLTAVTAWVWAASDRAFRRVEVSSPVVVREDIAYSSPGGHRLSLDVYLPPAGTTSLAPGPGRPAILAIHGGSWIGGSKRLFRPSPWNPHPTAIRLAEAGFVVIAADYRLAWPGAPSWPAARDDLREAVRWIRRHTRELGVNPACIAAFGQSAGGHLAAILGTSDGVTGPHDTSRVRAVVNFYGPSNLEKLPLQRVRRLAHEPVRIFLGEDPTTPSERARAASPIDHVRGDTAPMLLMHGTRDSWVPIAQSEELARVLKAADVMHRLIGIERAQHGFEAEEKDLAEIFAFLQSVWNAPFG